MRGVVCSRHAEDDRYDTYRVGKVHGHEVPTKYGRGGEWGSRLLVLPHRVSFAVSRQGSHSPGLYGATEGEISPGVGQDTPCAQRRQLCLGAEILLAR